MQVTQPIRHDRIRAFRSQFLGNARPIDMLLPSPDYGPAQRVLFLNDGQDLPALRVAPTLARLHEERLILPGAVNVYGQGARAAAYSAFVCEELLPELTRRYGLPESPAQRAIGGLSLGGLTAFDIAWRHPERFGAVAVLSGSFWWRTSNLSVREKLVTRLAHQRVRTWPTRPPLRFWLQTGTADEESDRDGDGIIDSVQDARELIKVLVGRGYKRGRDITYREVVGGRHEHTTWAALMPELLVWLSGEQSR
jgi:enterochelin esterase family protein